MGRTAQKIKELEAKRDELIRKAIKIDMRIKRLQGIEGNRNIVVDNDTFVSVTDKVEETNEIPETSTPSNT